MNYLTIDLLSMLTIAFSNTELSAKPECSVMYVLNQVAFKKHYIQSNKNKKFIPKNQREVGRYINLNPPPHRAH